jgi:tetratricopeptide (TPR) repeat protein
MGIIYMIAKCYVAMSKLEEAEKLVAELLSKKPEDFELMLFLGELFFEGNKYEDAKRMFNKCYKQEPRNLKLLINFAQLHDREGLIKEAISYLNDAKKISPDSSLVHFNLGKMFLKSRHYEEAVDEFKKVLEIDVDKTICYRYIGICYKALSRPDLAIASFKSAVEANPLDGELFVEIAEIYIKNEEYDNAGESLDRALQIKKDDLKALYLKGIVSAKKGIILEAIRKWEEVLAIAPESELAEEAKRSILVAQNWTEILGKKIK